MLRTLNIELDNISNWISINGLSLNVSKTHAICIFCTDIDTNTFPPLILLGQSIPFMSKVKNLGLTITSTLSWDSYINQISSKVHFILRRLKRFAYLTPEKTKVKLAKTLLMPHFLYCDVVLGALDSNSVSKLNSIFNACTRYVCGLRKYDHISLYTSRILGCTITNYFKYRHCVFLFKLLQNGSPTYLLDELTPSSSSRTNNFIIPRFKFKHLQASFGVYSSSLWNSLPHSIKHIQSLKAFKTACFLNFK